MSKFDQSIDALRKAVDDLTYPSESDEPFEVFQWDSAGTAREQVASHAGKDRTIEEVPVKAFFAQLEGSDDALRFQHLRQLLDSTLTGLQIFRIGVGETRVDVFLMGRLGKAQWAGLHTVSVET